MLFQKANKLISHNNLGFTINAAYMTDGVEDKILRYHLHLNIQFFTWLCHRGEKKLLQTMLFDCESSSIYGGAFMLL